MGLVHASVSDVASCSASLFKFIWTQRRNGSLRGWEHTGHMWAILIKPCIRGTGVGHIHYQHPCTHVGRAVHMQVDGAEVHVQICTHVTFVYCVWCVCDHYPLFLLVHLC